MQHSADSAKLLRIQTRIRAQTTAMDGPQEGVIVSATTTEAVVVVPAWSDTYSLPTAAPLPYGLTEAPTAGTRCLVVFVGAGVDDPWVVALTTVPYVPASG